MKSLRKIIVDDLAPNVKAYVGNAATSMIQGSFTLLHAFNGDARQGLTEVKDPENWKFVFPTPSANLWMDLGHPIGASGARVVLTLALELQRRGGGTGIAALCGGGGQGDSLIVTVPAQA